MPAQSLSPQLQACIQDCAECATICAQTAHHCLQLGGDHASPDHQGLLHDCKQLCAVVVGFMSRASQHASEICRLCATICGQCADDCERIANGDTVMQQCIQTCRKCAQSCENMASAAV
jgi:hypothetical protein